jgi:hypothetical protein
MLWHIPSRDSHRTCASPDPGPLVKAEPGGDEPYGGMQVKGRAVILVFGPPFADTTKLATTDELVHEVLVG